MIARLHEPGVLVVRCEMEENGFLVDAEPDISYETDHYKGSPAVLVRFDRISAADLQDWLDRSWRSHATKRMIELSDSANAKL